MPKKKVSRKKAGKKRLAKKAAAPKRKVAKKAAKRALRAPAPPFGAGGGHFDGGVGSGPGPGH